MGRLQRKKPPKSKKQKKQSNPTAAGAEKNGQAIASKAVINKDSSRSITKRSSALVKALPVSRTAAKKKKPTYLDQGLQFLREVKMELQKVTWPSRKQTIGSTAVVIILVIIISVFLGVVDLGLSNIVRVVLQ